MDLSVWLNKEAIEAQIVQSITESAIGEKIEGAINEALSKPKQYGADTFVESAVKQCVHEQIRIATTEALKENEEFAVKVRAAVEVAVTDETISAFVARVFEVGLREVRGY